MESIYTKKVYPIKGRTDFFKFVTIKEDEIAKDFKGEEMYWDKKEDADQITDACIKVAERLQDKLPNTNPNFKIQLNGGIIDFYVDRKKYEGYKTKRGQYSFVETQLKDILASLRHTGKEQGLDVRLADITSNHFWGQDYLCEINELGWRGEKSIPKNEKYAVLRVFHIDLASVVLGNVGLVNFPKFKGEKFLLECSTYRIV